MTGLEAFLTVVVVLVLAALVFTAVLLRRCLNEMKSIREHIRLINQDADGQLEVLDRIDRIIKGRVHAIISGGDMDSNTL